MIRVSEARITPAEKGDSHDEQQRLGKWRAGGKRLKLTIKNLDAPPAEFESHNFEAEKVVPAGGEVSLYIGPLKAGTYLFFDDFHEDQTKGTLIAK